MKAVEHPEKLTRIELRAKQTEIRKQAREGFADRLRKEMRGAKARWWRGSTPSGCISTCWPVGTSSKAAEECWEIVGNSPLPPGEGPG